MVLYANNYIDGMLKVCKTLILCIDYIYKIMV